MALVNRFRSSNSSALSAQLGTEIKCNWCLIVKNKDAFSPNRLADLANHAASNKRFNPKVTQYISCMVCSQRQVTELQCAQCDKWKGLDAFSKAQRKERDNAKCWVCMQEQLDTEPAGQSGSDEDDSDDSKASGAFYSGDDDDDDQTSSYQPTTTLAPSATTKRLPRTGGSKWSGKSATSTGLVVGSTITRSGLLAMSTGAASNTSGRASAPKPAVKPSSDRGSAFGKATAGPKKAATPIAAPSDEDTDECISTDDDD